MFQHQLAQRGFAGLGATDDRPTIDYVKAGDVIRVYVAIDAGLYFGSSSFSATFVNRLKSAFNLVKPPTGVGGGVFSNTTGWVVDLQPRSDYAKLSDVVAVVLHEAQESGLNVNVSQSYGQFVSKVETAGVTPPITLPTPGLPLGTQAAPQQPGIGDGLSNFFGGLTQSPVTLAVILGAAVVLVIAAKK